MTTGWLSEVWIINVLVVPACSENVGLLFTPLTRNRFGLSAEVIVFVVWPSVVPAVDRTRTIPRPRVISQFVGFLICFKRLDSQNRALFGGFLAGWLVSPVRPGLTAERLAVPTTKCS